LKRKRIKRKAGAPTVNNVKKGRRRGKGVKGRQGRKGRNGRQGRKGRKGR